MRSYLLCHALHLKALGLFTLSSLSNSWPEGLRCCKEIERDPARWVKHTHTLTQRLSQRYGAQMTSFGSAFSHCPLSQAATHKNTQRFNNRSTFQWGLLQQGSILIPSSFFFFINKWLTGQNQTDQQKYRHRKHHKEKHAKLFDVHMCSASICLKQSIL